MNEPHDPNAEDLGTIETAQTAEPQKLTDGIGICLSGGGYRAMLFHVGALWRLNETGILAKADRISSVSGGSITAGWLAMVWGNHRTTSGSISPEIFREVFATGLRRMAGHTIDIPSVLRGLVPGRNVGREVANAYDRLLFQGATLQNLPDSPNSPDSPRFVINSSNLQTGALWRFSKPYMGDWKVGRILKPKLGLATAVAASSAFPPVLSPIELQLRAEEYKPDEKGPLHKPPFNTCPVLSDGGVYDNLGLEPVLKRFRTVLVSDGGAPFSPKSDPSRFWPFQLKRVLDCIDNQVRALRKRDLIDSYKSQQRTGAYWGIGTALGEYKNTAGLSFPVDLAERLARTPTRLARMDSRLQEQLINWGYAVCTAALATHYVDAPVPETAWPYPAAMG